MPSQQPNPGPGPQHRGRWLAALAGAALGCAGLSATGLSCSVLIDQELSRKESGAAGAGGTGGQTSTSSTTTGPESECEKAWDCALAHATAVCDKGACKIEKCQFGFANCNQERLDGCEVDFAHDDEHCGKCDKDCTKDDKSCEWGQCD